MELLVALSLCIKLLEDICLKRCWPLFVVCELPAKYHQR